MPIVSDSVGCGWMVSPMSAASAPISIASASSLIRSPADHVADGEDVRDVGPHLLVGRDEAPLIDDNARVLGANQPSIRLAADGDQHPVESVAGWRIVSFKVDNQPVGLRRDLCDLRLE